MKTINICPADNESEEEWLQSAALSPRWLIKNMPGQLTRASSVQQHVEVSLFPSNTELRDDATTSNCRLSLSGCRRSDCALSSHENKKKEKTAIN